MKNSYISKALAIALSVLLIAMCIPFSAFALDPVSYVDENGDTYSVTNYTIIDGSSSWTISNSGWYVLNSNKTFYADTAYGSVFVNGGDVKFILCDDCTLSCYGIRITSGSKLTVYGQTDGTGKIYSYKYGNYNSVSGIYVEAGSQLVINSGTVDARGGYQKAGITGQGSITINGGTVNAVGGDSSAGIGAYYSDGVTNCTGSLVINGGNVTATGGTNAAGIGGAGKTGTATGGNWNSVEINGGTVTATGGQYAAGIGCGYLTNCGDITINGGTVTANPGPGGSNNATGEAIGKYGVYVTGTGVTLRGSVGVVSINGGNVTANGSIGGSSTVLSWTDLTDSIYATGYTSSNISILKTFRVGTSSALATPDYIAGQTIYAFDPQTAVHVNLYDDDGVTLIDTVDVIPGGVPVRPDNPRKAGYRFVEWQLNGSTYNFDAAISSDIDVLAVWTANSSIDYLDGNGVSHTLAANAYTALDSVTMPTTLTSGWYVVDSNLTYNAAAGRITVSGDVNLVIADGCLFSVQKGIAVNSGNSLTIYGQSGGTGTLSVANAQNNCAAIGGDSGYSCGTVTINGGIINATAYTNGAGIGGGNGGAAGNIVINGGTVTATGRNSAGIGCACNASGGTVTINGGTVTANGGSNSAAIGGSNVATNKITININGGNITANAYTYTNTSTNETTVYYGIGGGTDAGKADINLSWSAASDRITATNYNGTVNFVKNFVLENTNTIAVKSNIDGNTIAPYDGVVYSVSFFDETGSTILFPQQSIASGCTAIRPYNPTKSGYKFIEWRLNGVAYDFSAPVTANISLRAHWEAGGDIDYIDENGDTQTITQGNYEFIESTDTQLTLTSGWYVFMGDVSISKRILLDGTVNLILCDGAEITVPKGIALDSVDTLNIYGQANSDGELTITSPGDYNPAIGTDGNSSSTYYTGGTIVINGGVINAQGGAYAAGIGGGRKATGKTIIINGGTVNSRGGTSAPGIGSGFSSANSDTNITINGGTVNATGNSNGAGIGSSFSGYYSSIVINGGTINATGGNNAGIGGSAATYATQPITINGGTIIAHGSNDSAAIGGGYNKDLSLIVINGGNIDASTGGIGAANNISYPNCAVELNWTNASDSITSGSYNGSVTFTKDFVISGTDTVATDSNIAGETIIPDIDFTVSFFDEDGVTVLAAAQTVKNGMTATEPAEPEKYGYEFDCWLDGYNVFDFTEPVSDNYELTAHWLALAPIDYTDEDGMLQTCDEYWKMDSGKVNLSDAWYAVTDDVTISERITVSGTVNLILCDSATLNAVKGIDVPDGATLNIYSETRTGALTIVNPADGVAGIGVANGEVAGDINICGGVITVAAGNDASAIGGGVSGKVGIYGGNVTANGHIGGSLGDGSSYSVTLGWNSEDDSYFAQYYMADSITLLNDFFYQGTGQLVSVPMTSNTTIVPATNYIEYINEYGERSACVTYTELVDSTSSVTWTDGNWYVLTGDTSITPRITCSGTVNLVLCDGATLSMRNIYVPTGASLTIYAQQENTGAIINNMDAETSYKPTINYAGIGGHGSSSENSCGDINIYGGNITVTGGAGSAGIGGGSYGAPKTINISRATVNATGGGSPISATNGGAGIGGGRDCGNSGMIYIFSGDVNATGQYGGAGIGGGDNGSGGMIYISGGTVNATGSNGGAGIGCGHNKVGNLNITVSGGTVTAHGGVYSSSGTKLGGGAGIGSGAYSSGTGYSTGNIYINGGNVEAYGVAQSQLDSSGKPSCGIGFGSGCASSASNPLNVYLNYTEMSDTIYATSYGYGNLNMADHFYLLNDRYVPATASNIDGKTIFPNPYGDLDFDGDFDLADYVILHDDIAGTAEMPDYVAVRADFDKDTAVDAFDLFDLDRRINNLPY
jgi:hypothetical protein